MYLVSPAVHRSTPRKRAYISRATSAAITNAMPLLPDAADAEAYVPSSLFSRTIRLPSAPPPDILLYHSSLKPAELQVLRAQYEKEGEYASLQTKFNYAWVSRAHILPRHQRQEQPWPRLTRSSNKGPHKISHPSRPTGRPAPALRDFSRQP